MTSPSSRPPPGGFGYPPHGYQQPGYPPKPSGAGVGVGIGIGILVAIPVLVVVVGIVAVMAIYGVRKYIANAKTAEARATLSHIGLEAKRAYEENGKICPSASSPVPASAASVRAMKYQSSASDWTVDKDRTAGFACLGFSMSTPQYYQYDYNATADSFVATAKGDLNGDGVMSEFKIEGRVQGGKLVVSPTILETNPFD